MKKYTYESQKKALEYLIENAPHDMEKFQTLYNVEIEGKTKAIIDLRDILFSDVWATEEKMQLIKLYGHDVDRHTNYSVWNYKTYESDIGSSTGIYGLPLIDECIKRKSFSGMQALLNLGNHISVATIARIIEYIDNPSERYQFCELLVNHYKDKESIKAYSGTGNQCYLIEIPSLCDRYPRYIDNYGKKELYSIFSSMENICSTNDLELVKLFLPTVKNINPLFMFAVESKNIEMVKLFIDAGADVNFQDLQFECDNGRRLFKTPIKIAIDNNDLEMVIFLHQNGADLDFVDKSERMQEFIGNLGIEKSEKETHQYKSNWDRHDYIIWTKTPLEYAITLGAASIIDQDLINNNSTRVKAPIEKQFQDRVDIVRYLYENGATFGEGTINYTDLICFAIKSDDFETTKYYFEEALKNNCKLDFVKIIRFIHKPGVVNNRNRIINYKLFEEGAKPWFRLCEEYSKKIDAENYNRNIKLMLIKIFNEFSFNSHHFDIYRDLITDFSHTLPQEELKDIPAVFGVSLENIEEVLNLGYDINCVNEIGDNILIHWILSICNSKAVDKLLSLGAEEAYQNPNNGINILSSALCHLPNYGFGKFIGNFNRETGMLYYPAEEYEKDIKAFVKKMIDLSSKEIVTSDSVKQMVYLKIEPGYPQIIYQEILEALSKKGFHVDDDYFARSITFLGKSYSDKYITNPWGYLWNLYHNFDNQVCGTNYPFPNIEKVKQFSYGTDDSNYIFDLIMEHLKRNFATSKEQIKNPNDFDSGYYNYTTKKWEELNALQAAQIKLLNEIKRYIGNLDYRQILLLLDTFSLVDEESIIRAEILPEALKVEDINLCRELIKRGISIACYDENGYDITDKIYSSEQIKTFTILDKEYNPNREFENLLEELGCSSKVYLKKIDKK